MIKNVIKKPKTVNIDQMIKATSDLLTDIIRKDRRGFLDKTPFSVMNAPRITLQMFLNRIIQYSDMEVATLTATLIYLDRFCEINQLTLNINNIHRLIIGAVMNATKFLEDVILTNTVYAKIFGITLDELNLLESQFLMMIKYNLYVSDETFITYYEYLKENLR